MTLIINNKNSKSATKHSTYNMLTVSENELLEIKELVAQLKGVTDDFESPDFLKRARTFGYRLPERLVEYLSAFRYSNGLPGAILIRGIDFSDSGRTPMSMEESRLAKRNTDSDLLLILMSSILGEVFGWSSQREGDLINDVFPLQGNEREQLSTGSTVDLAFHTEEAFHPYRADYVGLTCIRNHEQAPTRLGSLKSFQLSPATKEALLQDRFIFEKDKNFENEEGTDEPESVLFGATNDPYLRIDPAFMYVVSGDEAGQVALNEIALQLTINLEDVYFQSGDFCFIDNYFLVHGRKAFKPLYDGTGRWLKRVNITTDLRKSRAFRSDSDSRVITPTKY